MKFTPFKILIATILLTAVVSVTLIFWLPGSPFRKIPVQGYVFIDKQTITPRNNSVAINIRSQKELFSEVNDTRNTLRPVSGVKVRFQGEKNYAVTDKRGFFELQERKYNIKKKFIDIDIFDSGMKGQTISYPAKPPSLLDQNHKHTHIVHIKKNGNIAVSYLRGVDENVEKQKQPLLLVHGFGPDFGPIRFIRKVKNWTTIKNMIETDMDLDQFDVFLFSYPDDQDIIKSSGELADTIELIRRIYNQQIRLLGFSAGGLVCRHYTVCDWYLENSIQDLLIIGTPNHGSDLAVLHMENDFTDGDGGASIELIPGSDFLLALNNDTEELRLKKKYKINTQLQDEKGLNPDVPISIIAGEVTESIREELINSHESAVNSMAEIAFFFNDFLNGFLGQGIDRHTLMMRFKESYKQGNNSINEMVDEIPPGDLVVNLDSAIIEGVPYITLSFTHLQLILPEDDLDIRYQVIKDYLITGNLRNSSIKTSIKI